MRLPYVLVDVFTDRRLEGNQLAVFPDVDPAALDADTQLAIARELNLSETTFVVGRGDAGPRVRIFTPVTELAFAGHPTLGTAAVLWQGDARGVITLELPVGPVPVTVERTASGWRAELVAPEGRRVALPVDGEALAARFLVPAEALDRALPVEAWASGISFGFVAVRDRAAVAAARPTSVPSLPGEPLGVMVFALAGRAEAPSVHARVFIPGSSVPEDPATGSANALLCAYLHHHGRLAAGVTLSTVQGVEMRRPSRLEGRVERDADGALRARVGGGVVEVARGALTL